MRGAGATILILALSSCGSSKAPSLVDQGAPPLGRGTRPSLPTAQELCTVLARVIDREIACAPVLARSLGSMKELYGAPAGADVETHRRLDCATALYAFDLQRESCDPGLGDAERAWVTAVLARRALVPPSGDAAVDAAAAKAMAIRDRVCACADLTCAETAADELDRLLGAVALGRAPDATRVALGELVDEIGACTQVVRVRRVRGSR